MKIRNVFSQLIAIPILVDPLTTSSARSSSAGAQISSLHLACGAYLGFWNGFVLNTGKEAASGIYVVQLYVDGVLIDAHRIYNRK